MARRTYAVKRLTQHRQNVAMFLFVVLAFVLLAGRSENQDRLLHEQARFAATTIYEGCLTRNANVARINAENKALYAIEKADPSVDDKTRAARLAIYGVMLVPARCERPRTR